jgi:hypothetical protein
MMGGLNKVLIFSSCNVGVDFGLEIEGDGCANVQRDQACTLIRGEKFTGLELWSNVMTT